MGTKGKIITIIAGLVVLGLVVVASTFLTKEGEDKGSGEIPTQEMTNSQTPDNTNTPSSQEVPVEVANKKISDTIIKKTPALALKDGTPTFTIIKYKEPLPGWYIATIRNNNTATEDARVILRGSMTGNLTIFAGPGTYFDNINDLPIEVKEAIFE